MFHASQIDGSGRLSRERTDMTATAFASNHCVPVIIHQTGDTLGIMISWSSGKYLFPIIWRVKESELFPATSE